MPFAYVVIVPPKALHEKYLDRKLRRVQELIEENLGNSMGRNVTLTHWYFLRLRLWRRQLVRLNNTVKCHSLVTAITEGFAFGMAATAQG